MSFLFQSAMNISHKRYMDLADCALVQWPALKLGYTPKQALVRHTFADDKVFQTAYRLDNNC